MIIVANGFEDVALRMAQMVEDGKLGGVAFESDDLSREYKGNVFVTPHNAYYTQESLEKMCAAVGIRKVGVHALRHTYATRLFEKGIDIKVIAELLGHSSTEITYRIYVHVIDSLKESAVEALDLD